jgi:carboxylesterase type B
MHINLLIALILPLAQAAPSSKRAGVPAVTLSSGTIVIGAALSGVDSFKGIPYAQPPIGALRLKPPKPLNGSLGTIQATGTPTTCPQLFSQANTGNLTTNGTSALLNSLNSLNSPHSQKAMNNGEDCLNLNIQRPSTATADSRLPVVFWIYGGGFEFGSTTIYDATELILASVAQNKDIIFVAVNYRSGGFGFLPGKEILADGSSNLGLLDHRLGLKWVADNIAAFGGDSSRVTLWGYSSGAISVFDQVNKHFAVVRQHGRGCCG